VVWDLLKKTMERYTLVWFGVHIVFKCTLCNSAFVFGLHAHLLQIQTYCLQVSSGGEELCSSVSLVTMLWAGQPEFNSWQGMGFLLLTTMSRLALGPTQPPIQWVPGALSMGVKQPGHKADHSPLSSAEVKNVWS
jgi:hypothetical protein